MYPEPHIPSAPTDRAITGDCQLSDLVKRTIIVLGGGALLFVTSLGISVMRRATQPAECNRPDKIRDEIAAGDPSECVNGPAFSSATHSVPLL
jgi:hypothetical protein